MKRIFLAFFQSKVKHPIPAYDFWIYYIRNGLLQAGYEIVESSVDWAWGLVPKAEESQLQWKETAWKEAIKTCRKENPSLFLSYLYPEQIDASAITAIKAMGIPCVNFFCDNVRNFAIIPKEFHCFSMHWVPEFQAIAMYQKAGLKVLNAPMPMWVKPEYRSQISDHEEIDQISFIGSKDILRALLMKDAIEIGVPLRIMGAGWEKGDKSSQATLNQFFLSKKLFNQLHQIRNEGIIPWLRKFSNRYMYSMPSDNYFTDHVDPKPSFLEYVELTRRSKIVLGVNRYPSNYYSHGSSNTYSRLRDIEAPMLGACYLTEYVEGLEQWYELGKEIETYSTVEDLKEKSEKLLKDSALRNSLRRNGQQRALNDLNISKTIQKIKEAL